MAHLSHCCLDYSLQAHLSHCLCCCSWSTHYYCLALLVASNTTTITSVTLLLLLLVDPLLLGLITTPCKHICHTGGAGRPTTTTCKHVATHVFFRSRRNAQTRTKSVLGNYQQHQSVWIQTCKKTLWAASAITLTTSLSKSSM